MLAKADCRVQCPNMLHTFAHTQTLSLFLFMVIALSCRTRSVLPARSWQSWRVPWWFRCCHGYAAQVIRVLSCVFPPVHMKSCCCCVCSSNLILYIDILPPVWFVVSPHYLPESIRGGTLFSYSHLRNFEHQLSLAIHWRGRQALWWGVSFFRNTENHRHGKGADKGKTYDILHTRFNIHIYIHVCVLQIISVYTLFAISQWSTDHGAIRLRISCLSSRDQCLRRWWLERLPQILFHGDIWCLRHLLMWCFFIHFHISPQFGYPVTPVEVLWQWKFSWTIFWKNLGALDRPNVGGCYQPKS